MRRLDSVPVTIPASDPFGAAAIALMRRMSEIGKTAALEEQIANPAIQDPDWIRMLSALLLGTEPVWSENAEPNPNEPTYRCPTCRDIRFVRGKDTHAMGATYETMKPCPTCSLGQATRRADEGLVRRQLRLEPTEPLPEKHYKKIWKPAPLVHERGVQVVRSDDSEQL